MSGTVKSVAADTVVLTTPKGEVTIAITPQTRVPVQQPASAGAIKPGAYLGTANQDGSAPDTGTGTEVHLADNGGNVNRPMNDSGLTMTNGHVKNVTRTATGQEMDIDYGEGKTPPCHGCRRHPGDWTRHRAQTQISGSQFLLVGTESIQGLSTDTRALA